MADLGGPWPTGVWLDENGDLYANEAGWFITHRQGAEEALPILRATELAYREARAVDLAAMLDDPPVGAEGSPAPSLVLRNGAVFDSETGEVRRQMTVLIEGARITAVGPAGSVVTVADARLLLGRG